MILDKYYSVRSQIKTGDVIVFSDKSLQNRIISFVTRSPFDHVGLTYWMSADNLIVDRLFLIESDGKGNNPDMNGKYRYGVQTLPLSQRIYNYDGNVYWLPLKVPLTDAEKSVILTWLFNLENKMVKYGLIQAISAGYHHIKNPLIKGLLWPFIGWFHDRSALHSIFCSQMDAMALQKVGRVPMSVDCSILTPDQLIKMDCFDKIVPIFGRDVAIW